MERPRSIACTAGKASIRTAVLLAVAAVSACASEPFSYLNGQRYSRIEMNTYDVLIASVDGTSRPNQRDIMVSPGTHRIVFQGPPSPASPHGELRSVDIDIAPCTRYWFEARKTNALMRHFEPAINYTEAIAGCHVVAQG